MRAFDFEKGRISLSDLLSEDPALPLPQVDLPEIGFDDRRLTDVVKQRCGSLNSALKRRHVHRGEGEVTKPLAGLHCLPLPMCRQWGVSLSVDERKRMAVSVGGRLAVDFGRSWRGLERALSVLNLVVTHRREGSSERPSVGSFALPTPSALACDPYVTPHRS